MKYGYLLLGLISAFFISCGENEKGESLSDRFVTETLNHIKLLSKPYKGEIFSMEKLQNNLYYLIWISDSYKKAGLKDKAASLRNTINTYLQATLGQTLPDDEPEEKPEEAAA